MQEITRTTPPEQLPQELTVHETAARTGLTPWTVYQLIHQGKIPHRRIGKAIFIPKTFFLLVEQHEAVTK